MYLSMQQAAQQLNMSRQWLWELIGRGEITVREIAGRRVVVEDGRFMAIRRKREKKASR